MPASTLTSRLRTYVDFTRPFTLLPPTLGVISGAITAFGSASNPDPARRVTLDMLLTILLGSMCAALLNAASNGINQYYDIDIDRQNKPNRHLVTGAISMREGYLLSLVLYAAAILPTWLVVIYPYTGLTAKLTAPWYHHECALVYLIGLLFTFIYSAPALGRTKRHGMWANVTIAVPRGMLLKVAGWSTVKTIVDVEPWYIGAIFGLFLLGAASTKDFADIEGDRAGGCRTLPIEYGVKKAAWMIAPFFVLPFTLIPIGVWRGILTGNHVLLMVLGPLLIAYGCYTVWLLVRRPEELAATENHPSWTHMYRMMMVAQVGFALAYVF